LWFAKTQSSTYHTIREPYKSTERLKHKITKNGKVWTPNPEGRHAGDVWHIPTLAGRRFAHEKLNHPTQKPLAICQRLVKYFSNPKDLVFVPFVGSGSECVAAMQMGRGYLGAELNSDYIKLTEQRIRNARTLLEPQVT
jgi:DNA modification methylase